MRPKVVLSVMALLMLGILAGWAWSAERAEQAEQAKAPAAGAQAEGTEAAEADEAEAVEAEGEAEEAPEKVKGWLCEVKMGLRPKGMKVGTVKLTPTLMVREQTDGPNLKVFADAEEGATYQVSTRETQASRYEAGSVQYSAEKYAWSAIERQRQATVDGAIQNARMGLRGTGGVRQEYERQIAELEAFKKPAKLEATEETKTFGDYKCVKYTLEQGEKTSGIVWVTKDVEVDAPVGALLAHSVGLGRSGGLPFLSALDELEGFPLRVNVTYYLPRRHNKRYFRFWFEKITETEFDPAELHIPADAKVSESRGGRGRGSGMPAGIPQNRGREERPPEAGNRR